MSDFPGSSDPFESMDLSDTPTESLPVLKPGQHPAKIVDVEIKKNNKGTGRYVRIEFNALDGSGRVNDFLNLMHENKDTQEIARRRYKSLLTASQHPNPDKPGNPVLALKGRTVGLNVVEPEERDGYTNKTTGKRAYPNGKLANFGAYYTLDGHDGGSVNDSVSPSSLDDEIPF